MCGMPSVDYNWARNPPVDYNWARNPPVDYNWAWILHGGVESCRFITLGCGIVQLITTGYQLIPFTVCTSMHFHAGDSFIDLNLFTHVHIVQK